MALGTASLVERSTVPDAAVRPALAPSLLSISSHHSDFWKPALFLFFFLTSAHFLHWSCLWVLWTLLACQLCELWRENQEQVLLSLTWCAFSRMAESGCTVTEAGVVPDVSKAPGWPEESFYCSNLCRSHPFHTIFAWEGKSSAWLVGAGLGICGETLQRLYMGHYIWKSQPYYSL